MFISFAEIWRIRQKLFHHEFKFNLELPEPAGPVSVITEKLYLPKKEHPDVSCFVIDLVLTSRFSLISLEGFSVPGE